MGVKVGPLKYITRQKHQMSHRGRRESKISQQNVFFEWSQYPRGFHELFEWSQYPRGFHELF